MKTIHELKEHESILITVNSYAIRSEGPTESTIFWRVTRVATGWIYQNITPRIDHQDGYFVPLTYYTNPNI